MNKLISFILGAVVPTTASAVAGITKAITKLEAVSAHHDRKAQLIDVRMDVLEAAQIEAIALRDEAAKIAKRFAKLVA
ncbi:hypothetical protein [Mesorhizobium sp. M7A.F.Ca.CA.004.02.1.1]|uniref:hypothetical protein n=1 Tax=Mesorhizobium sp. M7A.F.Ca.CA.004.02.1.1 TaxID=2496690 RepID=UPI000FCB35CB|nr:hypothetical protein [Mesorhizobium sp. M7A.F.Ca.CA.004.02.1.1]RVB02843.1 hypothetical protein EN912_10350 [Mesorhizobium sp. M7A.F.Ca.CA.004.02.1.1]